MSLKQAVIRGVKWTTANTVVVTLLSVVKIAVLARLLEKEDFGLLAILMFILGIMEIFNEMGLTSAILHKPEISKQQYSSLFSANLIVSIMAYLALLALIPLVTGFYNNDRLADLIPVLGLSLICNAFGRVFKTLEQKHLRFKAVAIFEIIASVASLVVAILLAIEGFGVYALIYSALLQYGLSNLFYLLFGIWRYGLLIRLKAREVSPFLKIGMYQVGGQVVNVFNRDLDILIIGRLFSAEVLGGYSLAKQLVFRPMQVLNPILIRVASPALARVQNDKVLLKQHYLRLLNVVGTINIPMYSLIILTAPILVQLMYGNGYSEITLLVRILSVYMIIRAVSSPVGALIVATGKTKLEFHWNLFTILITPFCVWVGSFFGVVGAATGLTLGIAALFIPGWKLMIHRLTGASMKEYLLAAYRPRPGYFSMYLSRSRQ